MAGEIKQRTGAVQEQKVLVAMSEKDISNLARRVVSELSPRGFPESAHKALDAFLQFAYSQPGPSAIALVDRQEGQARPILDVFVLWSSPLDALFGNQNQRIEEIGEKHDQLAKCLFPTFDSSLHLVDPQSPEVFINHLLNDYDITISIRLISFVRQSK